MQVSIKNIEETTFREFKAESIREGLTMGNALTLAMKVWIEMKKTKPRKSILDFKPKNWGKGTERLSENIDSVLY